MTPRYLYVACTVWLLTTSIHANDLVTLRTTPNTGIQPQAVVDTKGTLHLLYFQGEAKAGDLYYVRRLSGQERFSESVRVNSIPSTAIAVGTVRGGQLAVGNGRVHVAWNGAGPDGGMLYARLNETGTGFESQQQLMRLTSQADGGCTVAADAVGHVAVAWHAVKQGEKGEDHRQMWIARSSDDGKIFADEAPVWQEPTGACGCCSTRGFADKQGSFYFLYRSATGGDRRDIYLLNAPRHDGQFQGKLVHPWKISTCPMSTLALAEGPAGIVAAWDTEGKIYQSTIKPGTTQFTKPVLVSGLGKACKHPTLAVNAHGQTLVAWTEGTGWQRGGDLVWQVFEADGQPSSSRGRVERGVPVWGLVSAVVVNGRFELFH